MTFSSLEFDNQNWDCIKCNKEFREHRHALQHIKNSSSHNYCDQCEREFPTFDGLQNHLKMSNAHRSSESHSCPYCNSEFGKLSSLAAHIQHSHTNSKSVENFIRNLDPLNRITRPMITNGYDNNPEDFSQCSDSELQCCRIANSLYECPYTECSMEIRGSISNLKMHINSKKHLQLAYHCPGCKKKYIAIHGLITHWEYGCKIGSQHTIDAFTDIMQNFKQLRLH